MSVQILQVKAIPLQAWTGPEGYRRLSSQISRQLAHEGGKVVSPMHRPPLPAGCILVLISVKATVRPEGLYERKITMTPSAIEHTTF